MTRLYIIEQSAMTAGGHYYAYTRTVAEAASKGGLDVVILENRRFRGDWKLPDAVKIPTFTHTWGEAGNLWITDWGPGNVAYEFVAATRQAPARAGDHVLFHTLSYAELRAVLMYLGDLSHTDDLPFFHILLRYDPDVLESSLETYRPLFDRIAASPILSAKVLFHTDTDPLSEAFGRLSGVPFTTLPIPFAQDRLISALADRRPRKFGEPVSILYLGDARLEKNYAHLPAALTQLWSEFIEPGRLNFVLQSNFNTPGGEPGIMAALQGLGQYSPRHVEIISEPMAFEDYHNRLAQADAVIVPYDADRYQARSSGILIEAMAAGKPVVTSAGSWMATQVDASHAVLHEGPAEIGNAVATLVRDFDTYSKGGQVRAAKILAWSSGENFVRSLIESAAIKAGPAGTDAPRVLVIMNGDAMVLRNGASKVAESQFRYLRDAGYRLNGLFFTNQRDATADQVETYTAALKHMVAPYGLERVFVTGPGRYSADTRTQSSLRNEYGFSVAGEVARVAAFDVSIELVDYVRSVDFTAVLLNYVTNYPLIERLGLGDIPVICEIHDIQSFQMAIYAASPVQPADLDDEFALLAGCDHLISLNPRETAYVKDRLPDMAVTTTGVSIEPRPISVGTLAGCKNLAEVVSSCGPELIQYQFEKAWIEGCADQLVKLTELTSLDLVYVSSTHLANVSGLRWFLENVYEPYLVPAGVSMVIAGSVAEVGGWPDLTGLHFVGRVDDVAPLYAAAKIAVLPIIEGAGMPVKTAEAMSYGCPIVATTGAVRGMAVGVEGVLVVDEASAFAQQVLDLLKSPDARAQLGAKARRSSETLNGVSRYTTLMDEAFKATLGGKARIRMHPVAAGADAANRAVTVEWSDLIRVVNRLARSFIDNEALEPWALIELRRHEPAEVRMVLESVVRALMIDRSAPLLKRNTRLLRAASSARIHEEAVCFKRLIGILGSKSKGAEAAKIRSGSIEFVRLQNQVLDVWAYSPMKEDVAGSIGSQCLTALPSAEKSVLFHARVPERISRNSFGVVAANLSGGKNVTLVASQKVRLGSTKIFGEPLAVGIVNRTGPTNSILLREHETILLGMPRLVTSGEDIGFVDLVLAKGSMAELVVSVDGASVPGRAIPDATGSAYRFRLGAPGDHEQLKASISVTAYGGSAVLLEARTHVVVGDDPDGALAAIDGFVQKLAAPAEGDFKAILPVRELLSATQSGEPLRREAAASVRKPIASDVAASVPDVGRGLLSELLLTAMGGDDQGLSAQTIDQNLERAYAILWPNRAIGEALASEAGDAPSAPRHAYVASAGLTVEVIADYQNAAAAAAASCVIDGQELSSQEDEGPIRSWRLEGASGANGAWVHALEFLNTSAKRQPPKTIDLKWTLPAAQDFVTGRQYLGLTNFHAAEMFHPGFGQVWTGPGLRTLVSAPIALTGKTDIALEVSSFGNCLEAEDISIMLNGKTLDVSIERQGSSGTLKATYPGDGEEGVATFELVIFTRRMFEAPGDGRRLGICLNSIVVNQRISTGPTGSAIGTKR